MIYFNHNFRTKMFRFLLHHLQREIVSRVEWAIWNVVSCVVTPKQLNIIILSVEILYKYINRC